MRLASGLPLPLPVTLLVGVRSLVPGICVDLSHPSVWAVSCVMGPCLGPSHTFVRSVQQGVRIVRSEANAL